MALTVIILIMIGLLLISIYKNQVDDFIGFWVDKLVDFIMKGDKND